MRYNTGGRSVLGTLLLWLVMFVIAAVVGHFTITYILGAFFGDVTAWLALPLLIRAVISAVLASPSIPVAIVTFIVSLFISTPFL